MPETNESEVQTTSPIQRKQNERTEAKFYEDVNKLLAEAENLGAEYEPPNAIAEIASLKARRDASLAARVARQANDATEESTRNNRENLFKPMDKELTSLVAYTKAAGKKENELAALETIARKIKGARAEAINAEDGGNHISVSNRAYVTRTDNYAAFIEQYDSLAIETNEEFYKAATHRTKLAAYQAANNAVITAEAKSNASQTQYDQITYTDEDSLLNACIASKAYFKSKFKTTHYQTIAKTRFEIPSRLRKKK